jgi:mono/diheme cytochrome c family protein
MRRHGLILIAVLTLATAARSSAQGSPSGAETYAYECGYCHLPGGTGTAMLERRLGEDRSLLEERDDLAEDFIRVVVRNGIVSMPALTRVEVTDDELDRIVAYLTEKE